MAAIPMVFLFLATGGNSISLHHHTRHSLLPVYRHRAAATLVSPTPRSAPSSSSPSPSRTSSTALCAFDGGDADKADATVSSSSSSSSSPEIRARLDEEDYEGAYQALKRNPMLQINQGDARQLLNNLRRLVPSGPDGGGTSDDREKQLVDACTLLYKRLERTRVLRGFGCIEGEYPDKSLGDVTPSKLQQVTGLSNAALTPKQRKNYWTLAGIGLCAVQYLIGESLGLDPLYTTIPATFAVLSVDQLFYRGAGFESVYQKLFPEYRSKIVAHEAGHFLVAYLLGIPIRGCVTNANEARKYPEIKGQAGTVFYDPKLSDELAAQKVTRSSVDRLSVVLMAGIAAEALKFGNSEGGVVDERSLIGFLTSFSPPWNGMRIQVQARWAAMQAILLIREHQASFDALVEALERGAGVGDAVLAIEEHLPATLPAVGRQEERKKQKKAMELDLLLRYIQKVTWRVGGVAPVQYDGNVILGPNPHESKLLSGGLLDEAGLREADLSDAGSAVVGMDGYIMGVKKATRPAGAGAGAGADGAGEGGGGQVSDGDEAVRVFKEKIRRLELAARAGKLDSAASDDSRGIWINGLSATKGRGSDAAEGAAGVPGGKIVIPPPLEGYEERIAAMQKADEDAGVALVGGADGVDSHEEPDGAAAAAAAAALEVDLGIPLMQTVKPERPADDILASAGFEYQAPRDLLTSRRGYQMKRLENMEASVRRKVDDTVARIREVKGLLNDS